MKVLPEYLLLAAGVGGVGFLIYSHYKKSVPGATNNNTSRNPSNQGNPTTPSGLNSVVSDINTGVGLIGTAKNAVTGIENLYGSVFGGNSTTAPSVVTSDVPSTDTSSQPSDSWTPDNSSLSSIFP